MSMFERAARVAAPAALVLFVLVGAVVNERPLLATLVLVLVALATVVVIEREHLEGWPVVGALAVVALAVTIACNDNPGNVGWFGLCVVAGGAALMASLTAALASSVALVGVFVAEWTLLSDDTGWAAWIAGTLFTTVACIFARQQSDLLEQLREAQAGLADRARVEERNRIAREVHDVIGHSLTVSLMHVSSARLALEHEPEEARAALEEAERLGRQSLEEVRHVVGMMHESDIGGASPLPGVDQIADLVESVRRAGTPVDLEVVGETGSLTGTGGLALYRILQEALTNVARHAAGAPTTVRVEVNDDQTRLTVDSAGPAGPSRPGALGIVSMQERAEALGGRLNAGPGGSGWRVEAVLPA
jgi:signal transduction histidine kinase